MEFARRRSILVAILLLAGALRLAFVIGWGERFDNYPDSDEYLRVAQNVRTGRGFELDSENRAARAPLYPLFCAIVQDVLGEEREGIRLVQALLSTASVLLVYCVASGVSASDPPGPLGARDSYRHIALLAAALCAVFPYFIFYSALCLTETLFVFLVLGLALLAMDERRVSAPLAGIMAGLCSLTRPFMLLFPVFLGASVVVFRTPRGSSEGDASPRAWWGPAAWVCLFFAGYALALSPWVVRNYLIFGRFLPGTTLAGASLYEACSETANGGPAMEKVDWGQADGMSEVEKDAYWRDRAVRWVEEHPGRFLFLAVEKQRRFWSVAPNHPFFRGFQYMALAAGSYLVVTLAGMIGLVAVWRRSRRLLVFFLPLLFYLVLMHAVFVGSVRYRLPLEPFLAIFAAALYTALWRYISRVRED